MTIRSATSLLPLGMSFFKKSGSLNQSNFDMKYFAGKSEQILWPNEEMLARGLVSEGDDPTGEKADMSQLFGGSPQKYLAITNWRAIVGYMASGSISSEPYANRAPRIWNEKSKYFFSLSNPVLIGSSSQTETFEITMKMFQALKEVVHNPIPSPVPTAELQLIKKDWGGGILGELGRNQSGRDFMFVYVCSYCGNTFPADQDADLYPENAPKVCHTCLRENNVQ